MHSRLERNAPRLARILKEFETQFKWLAIWLFLLPFRGRRRRREILEPTRVRSVLFLRQDRIGDMVVTLPTIRALKRRFPDIKIGVLASQVNVAVIKHDAAVSEIHLYNKQRLGETLRTLRLIRSRQYDVVIDLMTGTSITSLILTLIVGSGSFKIGLSKSVALRRFYDRYTCEELLGEEHIAYQIGVALLPFGINLMCEPLDGAVRLSAEQWEKGAGIAANLRDDKYAKFVGINISAGRINRSWDQERYSEAVSRLSSRYPELQFVVLCEPRDYERGANIAKAGGENTAIIPEGLPLAEVIAVISKLDCVLSPDTSICHIAAGLGVPLLGFYSGSEHNFNRFFPLGRSVWTVRAATPDSIDGITVDEYVAAFDRVISELPGVVATR